MTARSVLWFGALVGGCALIGPSPPARLDVDRLVDPRGMSLYTFDRDRAYAAASECDATCAKTWEPFVAAAHARRVREFGILRRDDGLRQWTHRGKPLYLFAGDRRPEDRLGHGEANLWRLAQ